MAAVRHLGFWKFKFLTVWRLRNPFCIIVPNFAKIGHFVVVISRFFVVFQDGDRRHLVFWKMQNFNGLSHVAGKFASPCQISSKSVKWLLRCDNLTVFFKMVAVRHLGFWKFNFLTVRTVKRPNLHNRAKFRKDRSNRWGDIAVVIFKMAAAVLVFEKLEF